MNKEIIDTDIVILEVVRTPFGAFGGSDKTTEFQNALDFCENGTLWILKDTSGYLTSTLIPKADTTIHIESGTLITGITAAVRIFLIQVANVHIWGYGAELKNGASQTSSMIRILYPAVNCSVRGLRITGNTATNDCIYIGGAKDLHLSYLSRSSVIRKLQHS